jgi:hypothetical protein
LPPIAGVLFTLAISLLLAAMIAYQRGPGAFLWPRPGGGFGLFLIGFAGHVPGRAGALAGDDLAGAGRDRAGAGPG